MQNINSTDLFQPAEIYFFDVNVTMAISLSDKIVHITPRDNSGRIPWVLRKSSVG